MSGIATSTRRTRTTKPAALGTTDKQRGIGVGRALVDVGGVEMERHGSDAEAQAGENQHQASTSAQARPAGLGGRAGAEQANCVEPVVP